MRGANLIVAFLLVCSVQGCTTVSSPSSRPAYTNTALYPGRVNAIHIDGFVISHDRGMRWGNWRVRFGSESPVATHTASGEGRDRVHWVVMDNLACHNDVEGEKSCEYNIAWSARYPTECFISGRGVPRINVHCPQSIEFQ